ncbi:histidine phosphatase superfamily, partial [Mycena amicta]
MSRPMPRLWVIRHGETEWSLSGRHTGRTDLALTSRGELQIKEKAFQLVGEGSKLSRFFQTVHPSHSPKNPSIPRICVLSLSLRANGLTEPSTCYLSTVETPHHTLTEDCAEWNYGEYEGLLSSEIKAKNPTWSIWKDGCPGGESAEQMQARVDKIVADVREYHRQYKEEGLHTRDVAIVAHGHFSRVLVARWL